MVKVPRATARSKPASQPDPYQELDDALKQAYAAAARAKPSAALGSDQLEALTSVLAALAGATAVRHWRDDELSPFASPTRWRRIKSAASSLAKPLPGERRIQGERTATGFVARRDDDGNPIELTLPDNRNGDMLFCCEAVREALRTPEASRWPVGAEKFPMFEVLRGTLASRRNEFKCLTVPWVREALNGADLVPKPGPGRKGPSAVLAALASRVGLQDWTTRRIDNAARPLRGGSRR